MNTPERRVAELVKLYPHLYDHSLRDFKVPEKVFNSWKEIATKLGIDNPETCKSTWRNIRDKFSKAMKRMLRKGGDEDARVPRLFVELKWLRPFVRLRANTVSDTPCFEFEIQNEETPKNMVAEESSSSSGCTNESDVEGRCSAASLDAFGTSALHRLSSTPCEAVTSTIAQPSPSSAPSSWRKRRRDSAGDGIGQQEKHETDSFDRHAQIVADFMRKLPPRHCAIFKKRLQDVMFEMEMQLLDEQDRGTIEAVYIM